jgi:hypothetical protein
MEPTMINLKVLSTAAAITLVLPMIAPGISAAQAQDRGGLGAKAGGGGGGAAIGGGGGFRGGGGGGGGGGFRAGVASAPSTGGAPSGFRQAPTMGFRPTPGTGGSAVVGGGGRGNYYAGGGGGYRGGGYRHRGGGFWPGVAVGAGIGIGSSYGYYGSPYYADDSYGYYDDSAVAAGPPVGDDDAVAYCTQRYRSYDPASGTYLGNDGLRHPCPAQ